MSSSMTVSITIGAALSAGFRAATGGVEKTLDRLGKTTSALTARQKVLGKAIRDGLSSGRDIGGLEARYRKIENAIDRAARSQQRLNDLTARGTGLRDARGRLRGDLMDAGATAVAVGAPALKSVRLAGGFEDRLRDIAITGEMTKASEAELGKTIRANALRFNQYQESVAEGIGVLVAGGISEARELIRFTPVLAKAASATRAGVDELGAVFIAMRDNLHIAAEDSESALNMLTYTGKRGQFEIRDMAKWLPALAPQMAALGLTGKPAVAEIGAGLQIARKGAGSNDEAANNFRNFLSKMTAPDTIKDFGKAGIDLKASLIALRKEGLSPLEGMMQIITNYMGKKGPKAAADLHKALAIKDESERQAALNRLREAYKLGELFQDQQAMAFIKPALAHRQEFGDIKRGAMGAGSTDLLGADLDKRLDGFNERWKGMSIQAREVGLVIGNTLLPPLTKVLNVARPLVDWIGRIADRSPKVTAAVIGLATAVTLGKVAFLAGAYGVNLFRSGLVACQTVMALMAAKTALFQGGLLLAGGAARISAASIAGGLLTSLQTAAAAVWTFTTALLASPIGWIGLAIAGAALLIYKYWKPISGFFKGLWKGLKSGLKELEPAFAVFRKIGGKIKEFFSAPLRWIGDKVKSVGKAFLGWIKPVDDVGGEAEKLGERFGKVLAGLLKSALDLPGKMFDAGKKIVRALGDGMLEMAYWPAQVSKELGDKVNKNVERKSKEIKWPAQLFEKPTSSTSPQGQSMREAVAAQGTSPQAQSMREAVAAQSSGGHGNIVYSPRIEIQSAKDPVATRKEVDQALQLSQADFERMLARAERNGERKRFA